MKVTYKGIPRNLSEKLQEKLDVKFAKLSKLLDAPGGEKSAHVVVTAERHLHHAEITLQLHDHQLVGLASDTDLFSSLSIALEKLEKQALKHGARERDNARRKEPKIREEEPVDTKAPKISKTSKTSFGLARNGLANNATRQRIFRISPHERSKPITLDEALLQMEDGRDYLVYRDADQERITMLVRRRDGHFDLIEA